MYDDNVAKATSDHRTREAATSEAATPVPEQEVAALHVWMRQGHGFGVSEICLESGVRLWFEEDDVLWEPW